MLNLGDFRVSGITQKTIALFLSILLTPLVRSLNRILLDRGSKKGGHGECARDASPPSPAEQIAVPCQRKAVTQPDRDSGSQKMQINWKIPLKLLVCSKNIPKIQGNTHISHRQTDVSFWL
jgi:hypothetical protein